MQSEIKQFIQWLRRRNPQARTWRDYQYDLKQFAAFMHNRGYETITFHDIDHFVSQQTFQALAPATVNRRLAAITAFYTYLSTDDQELVCPVLTHRHYLREPRRLPRPVPEEDLRRRQCDGFIRQDAAVCGHGSGEKNAPGRTPAR